MLIPDVQEMIKLTNRQYKLTVRTYKVKLRERVVRAIKSSARNAKKSVHIQLEAPTMLTIEDKTSIRDSLVEDLKAAGYKARGTHSTIEVMWGE